MEPGDWKQAAGDYEGEVLSVFENDHKGKVGTLIKHFGDKQAQAIDIGCGVGKFLPLLARHFGEVHACDYSIAMLENARNRNTHLRQLTFGTCDMRQAPPDVPPADFVLCVNVIITASLSERELMWENLSSSVRTGGHVAIVVPALESALLARHRLVEWNLRDKQPPEKALQTGFSKPVSDGSRVAREGILDCGRVPTKHYLKTEITVTARRFHFNDLGIEKIEYPWNTEFHAPPRWMQDPFPWDWLAVLKKL